MRGQVFTKFISRLKELIKILRQEHSRLPGYRIISVEQSSNIFDTKIAIQIQGTRHITKISPGQLAKDDNLLSMFHPLDVKKIIMLSNKCEHSPFYKVMSVQFSEKNESELFAIRDLRTNKSIKKVASEFITKNKEMFNHMDPMDVYLIAHTHASEQFRLQSCALREAKMEEPCPINTTKGQPDLHIVGKEKIL